MYMQCCGIYFILFFFVFFFGKSRGGVSLDGNILHGWEYPLGIFNIKLLEGKRIRGGF